ncbi:MAG: HD-GYP domain-containing protein (c-di-GMP phosphodiesterase class II) [Candidatus Azotimanducaceae bacterium]|jgi:HD-GYP domain-containing protein (c-di-GMP phosphodiesterase class II)
MLVQTLPVISNAMDDVPTPQTAETSGDNTRDDLERIFTLIGEHGVNVCPDLHFLVMLALTIEVRTEHWQGKTYDALKLALLMNESAGQQVDNKQLLGATLAHDFAMAFLPLTVLDKQKKLSKKSLKVMRTHISSAAELIHRMQGWNESREIIMAHHEHFDGQGYPNQLADFEINPGAKLLAIVDAFVARSSNTMQAIMEINRYSGTQFDPIWVDHFNIAIKNIRSNQQQLSENQPKTS